MTSLLLKKYLRSRGLISGLIILMITGLISLYIGKIQIDRHSETIIQTAEVQKEQIQRHLAHVDDHIGLLLYYIRFGLANPAKPLSGLAIGHRDKRVPAQLVNIRNLEEQKNTQELINPYYQLLGNLDLSFVIIYLFPLFIIGACFNLLSEEKESGTWLLVQSQSSNGKVLITSKIVIRYGSVIAILLTLLISALISLQIPFDSHFILFSLLALSYVTFWFAIVWFVISLQKASNDNALILLSFWIAMIIVIPGAINNMVSYIYPIPEAFGTTIESREGYHNKWDQPKEAAINKFKNHYPQFESYEHPAEQSFSWFWYYAMQQMGDDESRAEFRVMEDKLKKRDRLSKIMGYMIPSVHTQLSMNTIGQSDLTNYRMYIKALTQFHESKRLYFYPKIFDNKPISDEDWPSFQLEYFEDGRQANWLTLIPIFSYTLLFLITAQQRWSRQILIA